MTPTPIRILILAANPFDTAALTLDEEYQRIHSLWRSCDLRDQFEVHPCFATKAEILQSEVLQFKPHLIHFSGHGETDDLIFADPTGNHSYKVSKSVLADLFKLCAPDLKAVFLNACHSAINAEDIVEHVDYFIGMNDAIDDKAGTVFSQGFYSAIFNQTDLDIEQAFKAGLNQMEIAHIADTEQQLRVLQKRPKTYVPSYKHDIFISFADADAQWATDFISNLEAQLRSKLATFDGFQLYINNNYSQLEPSAMLLIIASPAYCQQYASQFEQLGNYAKRQPTFLIEITSYSIPSSLTGVSRQKFWVDDDQQGITSLQGEAYIAKANEVAELVAKKLQELRTKHQYQQNTAQQRQQQQAARNPDTKSIDAFIFLHSAPEDLDLTRDIVPLLEENGIEYVLPLTHSIEMKAEDIRKDIESNILSCDAVLILYEQTTPFWVREQLNTCQRVQRKRKTPLKIIAVYKNPDKPELDLKLKNLHIYCCPPAQISNCLAQIYGVFMSTQPYIGLRPFERNETDIFFGREQHTDQLIDRLGTNHFLAVIGTSGCGKSSLVKTGLIAGLEAGYLASASTHWRIVEMRPGNQPFQALADKLFSELNEVLAPHYTVDTLQQTLRQGSLSLHELLGKYPLPNNAQLLIVCDQFEEIFRYAREGSIAEARNFVSLLLASSQPYPISAVKKSESMYVVITMRSEFLGNCAQFAGLAEAINQGLYLTPRLDAEQLRAAIEEPAFIFDGEIEPDLMTQLLEDAQKNQDQLPLLQHVLMRLWDLTSDGSKVLTLDNYKDIGGLNNALSLHADKIYNDQLTDKQKKIAEKIFRSLVERHGTQQDIRKPTELARIIELINESRTDVIAVINVFRQAECCFLMSADKVLQDDSVIDISHESLIRQWQRLKEWADKEDFVYCNTIIKRKGAIYPYGILKEDEVKKRLWSIKLIRKDNRSPFYKMQIVNISKNIISSPGSDRGVSLKSATISENMISSPGSDRGVSLKSATISENMISSPGSDRGVSLKSATISENMISSPGSDREVSLKSATISENITSNHNFYMGAFLKSDNKEEFNKCQWEYIYDANNVVIYEKSYDKNGDLIDGFIYLPRNESDLSAKAFYIDADGYPTTQKDSEAEYVEFTYSNEGYEKEVNYFNRQHNKKVGPDKTYGYKNDFDENGLIIKITTIDKKNMPMNSSDGYAIKSIQYDKLGNKTESSFWDAIEQPTISKYGYHKIIAKYDEQGNQIEEAYFGLNNEPVLYENAQYHKWTATYDDKGNRIEEAIFGLNNEPVLYENAQYHKWTAKYDEQGKQIEAAYFGLNNKPVLYKESNGNQYHKWTAKYDNNGNRIEEALFGLNNEPVFYPDTQYHKWTAKYDDKGNRIERAVFGLNNEPMFYENAQYHKWTATYDEQGNPIEGARFGLNNEPVLYDNAQYHKWTATYDEQGKQIEGARFGLNNEPVLYENAQYHKWTATYDEQGKQIEGARFGLNNEPVLYENAQYHKWTATYDDKGNRIEEAVFGLNNEPVFYENAQYHKWTATYDEQGKQIEEAYFGLNNEPVFYENAQYHKWTATYDEQGNQIEEAYFGLNNEPVFYENAQYHKWTATYDEQGKQIEGARFGLNNEPVLYENAQCHKWTATYDDKGNRIEEAVFGLNNEPVLYEDGQYHKWTAKYDDNGKQIEGARFGLNNEPV